MVSCHNGELDTSKYSSPVPAIGVYIAVATLVCLLSITFDLWYGLFRRKFPWLPSKLFSLNSFSLTIISAATKLAVDLTTPMPGPIDQFSKLTATVFLCVSLGLFLPSVGSVSASDRIVNLWALSIIVITTIVDIVIQLFTGVIFSFFLEHLIIISCMLFLLLLLWSSSTKLTAVQYFSNNLEEFRSINSISDMEKEVRRFHRNLNVEYPLRYLFRNPNSSTAGALCSVTTAVLLEAAVRTISGWESRFCNGISDYQWSIWLVVINQLLTIRIGTVTVVYRWIMVVNHSRLDWTPIFKKLYNFNSNWTFRIREWRYKPIPFDLHNQTIMSAIKKFKDLFTWVLIKLQMLFIWTGQLVEFLCLMVRWPLSFALRNYEVKDPKEEPEAWIKSLIMADMERWIELNNRAEFTNLNRLLSENFSQSVESHSLLGQIQDTGSKSKNRKYEISSLSLVVLTRIASSSLPLGRTDFLFRCLKEAIEIISFIEEKFNNKRFGYESKLMHMNVIYEYLYNPKFDNKDMTSWDEGEDNVDSCLAKIERAPGTLFKFKRQSDVQFITESIRSGKYESIDHLYDCIERTFQEMVIYLMADLPRAILMEYYDCPLEESEERTRRALKFFCQLEFLGDRIQWSWPKQSNFFSLPKRMCNDARVQEFLGEKKASKKYYKEKKTP